MLLFLALLAAILLFYLLRGSLRELLRHTVKNPDGITFYVRSFLLVLLLSALSATFDTSYDLKAVSRFME